MNQRVDMLEPERGTGPAMPATRGELATLWVDEPGAAFNVAVICRFDAGPIRAPDDSIDVSAIRAEVVRRAAAVPTLRRRLTDGPHPAWVEDAARPDKHVDCAVLPSGTDILDWCAARIVEPLDRTRPLWRAWVVAPNAEEFVLLFVAHHVLADGRRGVAILRELLDDPPGESPGAGPGTVHRDGASALRSRPWRRIRDAVEDLRGRAPRTSLSRPVGPQRRIAVARADLGRLRALEATCGATVNDALLAAVTAGLRALLSGRGEPVDQLVLRASVPVSSGGAGQPEGMLLVALPVNEAEPLRRLAAITSTTATLKHRLRAGGGNAFDVLHLPTPLARAAVRWMRRMAAGGINLFVTNVPGPPEPLFLAGARLLGVVPVAPLSADVPLGIAALSYAGSLEVGVNADAAVTDLDVLCQAMEREFAALVTPERA